MIKAIWHGFKDSYTLMAEIIGVPVKIVIAWHVYVLILIAVLIWLVEYLFIILIVGGIFSIYFYGIYLHIERIK